MFGTFLGRPRLLLAALIAVAVAGPAAAAAAQERPGAAPAPLNAVEQKARDAVLARYRALSIQNGVVLVPRARIDGVESIELRGGTIAVNGQAVTGAELRDRLGRDADPILALSYFDATAQQRMLVQPEGAAPAPAVAPAPSAPAPPGTAAPEWTPEPERTFHRQVDARVRIFGDVTVGKDEQVNGAVVTIGGSARVDGRVRDDVVAIGGNVRLGPHAEVFGDVVSVGGTIERDPGAVVGGRSNEVAVSYPGFRIRPDWQLHWLPWREGYAWPAVRLFGTLVRMALFALLAVLIVLVVPQAVRRVEFAAMSQPWKSALAGLLAQLFFLPFVVLVIVVLAISIIGIPLLVLVPFGVLAFFGALILGFTGAVSGLARAAWRRPSGEAPGPLVLLAAGLAAVWALTLAGRVLGLAGGPVTAAAVTLIFVGALVEYGAWTVGLGAVLITRFGRRGPVAPDPYVVPSAAEGRGPSRAGQPPADPPAGGGESSLTSL